MDHELLKQAVFSLSDELFVINPDHSIEFLDALGNKKTSGIPTHSEIKKEYQKLKKEHDKKKYQKDRKTEYPEIDEQLDMLWHAVDAGEFGRKAKKTAFFQKLKAVKEKFPKKED